ncbi:MAG: STAS-like domain-containing protein [Nitrospinae bacterium]|nr:STAS-like domain-containing protein [Nitrospinota bacterium]
MNDQLVIMPFEIVGSGICVSSDNGQKIHDQITKALREGKKVNISFLNIGSVTSAFLNAAIGQLYGEFAEETIKDSLSVSGMDQNDLVLLKRVVETAKEYFKDPERFKKTVEEILEGENAG